MAFANFGQNGPDIMGQPTTLAGIVDFDAEMGNFCPKQFL
jgi:hypothetical protein